MWWLWNRDPNLFTHRNAHTNVNKHTHGASHWLYLDRLPSSRSPWLSSSTLGSLWRAGKALWKGWTGQLLLTNPSKEEELHYNLGAKFIKCRPFAVEQILARLCVLPPTSYNTSFQSEAALIMAVAFWTERKKIYIYMHYREREREREIYMYGQFHATVILTMEKKSCVHINKPYIKMFTEVYIARVL